LQFHYKKAAEMLLKIYLTGTVHLEMGESAVEARRFQGRQSRLAFAYLVCERGRPVPHEELAEVVWPQKAPEGWRKDLSSLISRLRVTLNRLGGPLAIQSAFGCYQLETPADLWVDIEAAAHAVDQADGAVRSNDEDQAWGPANLAVSIARRGFLPGVEARWIERQRARLHDILVRGLDCLAEVWLMKGETTLCMQAAAEALALEPYRETAYQRLMQAHVAVGNRGQALRVYEQCRTLLSEELGVDPSAGTTALYLELLGE
jgi:DNA-binding SARP family transcriptional activator